jgi:hypothetical protein
MKGTSKKNCTPDNSLYTHTLSFAGKFSRAAADGKRTCFYLYSFEKKTRTNSSSPLLIVIRGSHFSSQQRRRDSQFTLPLFFFLPLHQAVSKTGATIIENCSALKKRYWVIKEIAWQ